MAAGRRKYERFAFRGANFRISCPLLDRVTREIVRLREVLETYIGGHEEFLTSLVPVAPRPGAPEIALRMARAARLVGVGPMAAVAGATAQLAAEAALADGADEAIVENGGDIYLASTRQVVVGLYVASGAVGDRLALAVPPDRMPIAICSSSSRMGHSMSLGDCDLATVVSSDAALADAAATQACNLVRTAADLDTALARINAVDGVDGLLLVKADRVGLIGNLPNLVQTTDADLGRKVTRDAGAG